MSASEHRQARTGGDVVVETLERLGVGHVFGIPGQHALGLFDAIRRSGLQFVSSRVENNSVFGADGYARATGHVGVVFLSTGPGALTALGALQEASAACVPLLVIVSQIPRAGLGGARKGMLHQLDDQSLSARNVTKSVATARQLSHIPSMLTDAWSLAQEVPAGPVWVEIPEDLLLASAESIVPVQDVRIGTSSLSPRAELIAEAVQLLNNSVRPVILAGGGVRRSPGGSPSLARLAERLDASVVSTVGGKGAISFDHPLSAASWIEDRHTTNLLANADVLIAVGTSMGEVTSNYFTLELSGRLIHIDAEVRVLESNFAGLAIHSDAALAMDALTAGVSDRRPSEQTSGARVAADLRQRVESRLDSFELTIERSLLRAVRDGTPSDAHTFWDMTIAGYWAWSAWDPQIGAFESAQASGGLGFAFPAALAASIGMGRRTLAVTGDGGAMYSISELATAVQHQADVTWLIIDDGGYGILREYMTRAFGVATTTELGRPDFVALAHAFGIDAVTATPDDVGAHIEESWSLAGPRVIVVNQVLRMFPQT